MHDETREIVPDRIPTRRTPRPTPPAQSAGQSGEAHSHRAVAGSRPQLHADSGETRYHRGGRLEVETALRRARPVGIAHRASRTKAPQTHAQTARQDFSAYATRT